MNPPRWSNGTFAKHTAEMKHLAPFADKIDEFFHDWIAKETQIVVALDIESAEEALRAAIEDNNLEGQKTLMAELDELKAWVKPLTAVG